jgi:glycosyl transferase family 87
MFKINDKEQASKDSKTPKSTSGQTQASTMRNQRRSYLLDTCIIVAMGVILFWGVSTQFSNRYNDATRYQCYAIAFWQGQAGIHALGLNANAKSQCAFLDNSSSSTLIQKMQERHFPAFLVNLVASQPTTEPFHALPPEYPLLTLVPFSLPLLAPAQWYQVVFAICMAILAGIIYLLLKRYRSTSAAIAFGIYLVLGSWATAEGRFDLIPAGLMLGAVILAARARWKWAFALLALATLFKFYPAILIPPFLIAQQMQSKEKWFAWSRWSGLGVFLGICAVVTIISLLLNVANTLYPFTYFQNRPIQVESFPATLLWLGSFLGHPIQYTFQYQSLDFLSSLSNKVSLLSTLLLGAGLLYTFWLQWRGKIDLSMACLLTMLILLITGKVFSPQYLIWVAPLVAYAGGWNWKWLLSWGSVSILTTVIFPYLYVDIAYIKAYYPVILARDVLIVAIVGVLLFHATRKPANREFASQSLGENAF